MYQIQYSIMEITITKNKLTLHVIYKRKKAKEKYTPFVT